MRRPPRPTLDRSSAAADVYKRQMHITALAWTGGHGVQRKTAGAAQGLQGVQEVVGMGLMGLGGLVAVIGGVMFLVVVLAALLRRGTRS